MCRYIRQYFLRGFFPSGGSNRLDEIGIVPEALLRATVIAGARHISGTVKDARGNYVPLPNWYPNFAIGFGRTVLDRALYALLFCCHRTLRTDVFCSYINTSSISGLAIALNNKMLWTLTNTIAARSFKFECASQADITVHVVLVWTDPAGNPAALKQIVNDLDLIVFVDNSSQTFGNMQSFPDTSNTVEKAVVSCPSGSSITAIVQKGSFAARSSQQSFALVANGNILTEFAREVTPVPMFNSGRATAVPKSNIACPLSAHHNIEITAPLLLKPATKLPDVPLSRENMVSHFAASLSMFLGVPLNSVHVYTLSEIPWIGFSCGAYVCSARSVDTPCYQVGCWDVDEV
jgi:hypothetical protein